MAALLFAFIAVGLVGAVAHEVAHWAVWCVSGRRPELDLWQLEVRPRAGPQSTTLADRVAAAAPYALGMVCVGVGWTTATILLVVFGLAMIQIPSSADVMTILGRTTWRLPSPSAQ